MNRRNRRLLKTSQKATAEAEALRVQLATAQRECATLRGLLEDANRSNARMSSDAFRLEIRPTIHGEVYALQLTLDRRMLHEMRYRSQGLAVEYIASEIYEKLMNFKEGV